MISALNHIQGLLDAELPTDEYVVINSAWLTLMGLRANGDLDLIISQRLRDSHFPDTSPDLSFGVPGAYERRLRVHADSGPYSKLPGIRSSDEVVYQHNLMIDGLPFVTPRLYFLYKQVRLAEMQRRLAALPWYLRHRYFSTNRHKIISKLRKDRWDFAAIKMFFNAPRPANLAQVTDTQWGLDDPQLAVDLTDHGRDA